MKTEGRLRRYQDSVTHNMLFRSRVRDSHKPADEELLSQFRAGGDLKVLGELYSRYMHLVYGICLKYLKNNEEAKDGVMQIFEKLITVVPGHNIVNFKSWLHVVAKNYCLMQIRSDRSGKEKLNDWLNDPVVYMENVVEMHPLDEEDEQQSLKAAIEDCIKKLNEEQRSCIIQFYYNDRCYNEISANLGIDEKKVKSHLQNGKRNLKICLERKNVRKE